MLLSYMCVSESELALMFKVMFGAIVAAASGNFCDSTDEIDLIAIGIILAILHNEFFEQLSYLTVKTFLDKVSVIHPPMHLELK